MRPRVGGTQIFALVQEHPLDRDPASFDVTAQRLEESPRFSSINVDAHGRGKPLAHLNVHGGSPKLPEIANGARSAAWRSPSEARAERGTYRYSTPFCVF